MALKDIVKKRKRNLNCKVFNGIFDAMELSQLEEMKPVAQKPFKRLKSVAEIRNHKEKEALEVSTCQRKNLQNYLNQKFIIKKEVAVQKGQEAPV